jgi:nucleoid-associated protein YgaU
VYRCPNPGCRREIKDNAATRCPSCGFDLEPLARVAALGDYHYNQAVRLAAEGKEALALESLLAAVTLNPDDGEAHLFLGRLYARQGNRLARVHAEKASELNPALKEEAKRCLGELAKRERQLKAKRCGAVAAFAAAAVLAFALGLRLGAPGAAPGREPAPAADLARAAQRLEERLAAEPMLQGAALEVAQTGQGLAIRGRVITAEQLLALREIAASAAEAPVNVLEVEALLKEPVAYRYRLQEGETLWEIAQRVYGNPQRWMEIARASGVRDPSRLPAGRELVVPSPHGGQRSPGDAVQGGLRDGWALSPVRK